MSTPRYFMLNCLYFPPSSNAVDKATCTCIKETKDYTNFTLCYDVANTVKSNSWTPIETFLYHIPTCTTTLSLPT